MSSIVRHRAIRLGPLVVAGLVVSVLALPAAGVASARASAAGPVPELEWVDCGGGFECATATVPLDYDEPDGEQIELALKRRPADDQADRIGSLFLNPGGPGGSGVDFVEFAEFLYQPEVLARFDVVGFDPRGVGASTPARCFATSEEQAEFIALEPVFPVGHWQEGLYADHYNELGDRCERNAGPILANMSSADAARDLDVLRAAVGDEFLSYAGYSYGTVLGQNYLALFPDRVRAVILDGVLDPRPWVGAGDWGDLLPFSTRIKSGEGTYAALQGFLTECEAAGPAACGWFATGGDPHEKFEILADRLLQEPSFLSYADLIGATLGTLYSPFGWPEFAAFLQVVYESTGATDAATSGAPARPAGPPRFGGDDYANGYEAFTAVSCLDSRNPTDPRRWPRVGDLVEPRAPHFGRLWTWASIGCADWPVADLDDRYEGPWDHQPSDDVLVVGTRFDPATRYEAAVAVDDLLPSSHLLTLEGYGHTSIAQSVCIDSYVTAYLVDLEVPPEGATCESEVPPFGVVLDDAAAARASVPRPLPPQLLALYGGS